ncbi:MAG TPA: LexA family transcriptional regulator, partial [Acidimicrobiales bacterium]|nr:LexA family transcriptional regulator [Acidimicrobiales bacterium]
AAAGTVVPLNANETLGRLIARLRREHKLSQAQLVIKTNVILRARGEKPITRSWLSKVENDRFEQPDREWLEAIAGAFGIPAEPLLSAAGYRVDRLPIPQRDPLDLIREGLARLERQDRRPLVLRETGRVAYAGDAATVEGETWTYLPEAGQEDHDYGVLVVEGDCLEPDVQPGWRAVVDYTLAPDAQHGDYVYATIDGAPSFRRLEYVGGVPFLVANKHHDPVPVDGERVRINGLVRHWTWKVR